MQNTVDALKDGKVLLYPSDTVWGLGCDATNAEAIAKLDALKQREKAGYIILVCDDQMLMQCVKEVPDVAWELLDNAVDPLTIIYDNGISLAPGVCAADGNVAIRMVKKGFIHDVMRRARKPITSTSANLTGEPTPKIFSEISQELIRKVDHVVNLPEHLSDHPRTRNVSIFTA